MSKRKVISELKSESKVSFISDCLDPTGFFVVEVDGIEICRDWHDKVVNIQSLCSYLGIPWEEVELTEGEFDERY